MTKVYEVDPNADALIIVSGSGHHHDHNGEHHDAKHDGPAKSAAKGQTNGVVNGDAEPSELRLKVSSKHLSLASRTFRNKFGRHGEHFTPVESDGRTHFRLDGYDPEAVTVVMNIVHSRGARVPRTLDLAALTRVAAFVHAYRFDEAVEAYTDRWLAALDKSVPKQFDRPAAQWLFLAEAFQNRDLFRRVSRLAILQSTGSVAELLGDLHIPDEIISHIEAKRQELVSQVVVFLEALVHDLREGKHPCNNGCDAFLLGVLIKALDHWKLAKPYQGISFEALAKAVRNVQDQVWYTGPHPPVLLGAAAQPEKSAEPPKPNGRHNRFGVHHCGIRSLINPKLYSLEVQLKGLDLKN